MPELDFDTLSQIVRDVTLGIPPQRSKIHYTDLMLQWRKKIEQDLAKVPEGQMIDVWE